MHTKYSNTCTPSTSKGSFLAKVLLTILGYEFKYQVMKCAM